MHKDKMTISVAMAVYNGEKYLEPQITSILNQLGKDDELIISYNESKDATWKIITDFQKADTRVKCYKCEEKGIIANFNNAIGKTSNYIIFLTDQDDIWENNKVEQIKDYFSKTDKYCVLHNCSYIDSDGNLTEGNLFAFRNARLGIGKNLIINCYQGCCMAFTREIYNVIYPIPENVPMHDQWIGLCSELLGKSGLHNSQLIKYRRHDSNNSAAKVGYRNKIKGIFILIYELTKRVLLKKR